MFEHITSKRPSNHLRLVSSTLAQKFFIYKYFYDSSSIHYTFFSPPSNKVSTEESTISISRSLISTEHI